MGVSVSYPAQTANGMIYIDGDVTTAITNSIVETTLGSATIPPNILKTRCIVRASIHFKNISNALQGSHFKLYIGPTGAEVSVQDIYLDAIDVGSSSVAGMLQIHDTAAGETHAQNYTAEITVLIKATNSAAAATITSTCYDLTVEGL